MLLSTTALRPTPTTPTATADGSVRDARYANWIVGAQPAALEVKHAAKTSGHARERPLKFNHTGRSTVVAKGTHSHPVATAVRATTSAAGSDYSASATVSTSAPGVTVFYDPSDPNGANAAYYNAHPEIADNFRTAWADWASHLASHVDPATGQPANISLQVRFDAGIPTANGGSVGTPHVVGTQGGFNVYEEAVAYKIETGIDTNGSAPDGQITIGDQPGTASYLRNVLWFDPSPATRGSVNAAPVPAGKTDAYGRFLHEIGHILGINGKRDGTTGNIFDPNHWRSTFDALTTVSNGKFFFTGPAAREAYLGKDVPLTPGQTPVSHLGNASGPGNASDSLLDKDPMSGFATYAGFRNFLSPVDINILRDIGLPVVDPEPYVSISPGTTYTLTAPATQPNTPPTLRLTAGQMSVGTGDLDRLYPGITVIRSNGAVLTTGLQTRPLPTGVSASAGAQYSYVDGLLSLTSGTVTFVDGLQLYWLNIDAQGSVSHLVFNGSDNIKGLTLGGGANAVFQ
ncbi:MAG TPA: hypothetical protein VL371_01050 [Gemmataceae bacterium]|nr:hypothetical protein [Gemmataceae bacterium]